jgi:hypothetical protein
MPMNDDGLVEHTDEPLGSGEASDWLNHAIAFCRFVQPSHNISLMTVIQHGAQAHY